MSIKSRRLVQFPSVTGSCSYEVCCDMGEDAFELFRSKHGSKKQTFTSPVKSARVSLSKLSTTGISSLHECADSLRQLFHQCMSSDSSCTYMYTPCHLLVHLSYIFQLCYLQASSSLAASMFLHADPLSFHHQQTCLLKSALDHLIMVPNYVLYMLVFSYITYACHLLVVYMFAENLYSVQARCLLVYLVLLLAL